MLHLQLCYYLSEFTIWKYFEQGCEIPKNGKFDHFQSALVFGAINENDPNNFYGLVLCVYKKNQSKTWMQFLKSSRFCFLKFAGSLNLLNRVKSANFDQRELHDFLSNIDETW